MLRTRELLFAVATTVAALGPLVACGGDDTVVTPPKDAGKDVITPPVDGGMDGSMKADASDGGTTDGGDAGPCDFNQFVLDLIKNHTNNTDKASIDLGQNCVDTQTKFPATTFQ
jgi:hypothetical protein